MTPIQQAIAILEDDALTNRIERALEVLRGVPQSSREVSVDLMQRIWANLYFNEEDAGNTFQATLNEVVDWLAERDSLPPDTRPDREGE